MRIHKIFTLKYLKSLQHVSILRSFSEATLFLAKVTFLKTLTDLISLYYLGAVVECRIV